MGFPKRPAACKPDLAIGNVMGILPKPTGERPDLRRSMGMNGPPPGEQYSNGGPRPIRSKYAPAPPVNPMANKAYMRMAAALESMEKGDMVEALEKISGRAQPGMRAVYAALAPTPKKSAFTTKNMTVTFNSKGEAACIADGRIWLTTKCLLCGANACRFCAACGTEQDAMGATQ